MDLSNLPPLLQSDLDPIILGPKTIFQKLEHLLSEDADAIDDSAEPTPYPESSYAEVPGLLEESASIKYSKEVKKKVSREKLHWNKILRNEQESLAEEMLGNYKKHCKLKRVGSCYVLVRKDDVTCSQDDSLYIGGSRSTLPGTVDYEELENRAELSDAKEIFFSQKTNRFWNAKLQLSSAQQMNEFTKSCHHSLLQMRKFLVKLQSAIQQEESYKVELEKTKLHLLSEHKRTKENLGSNDSLYDSKSSEFFANEVGESASEGSENISIRPPKLGKVYAELNTHFKVWDELMSKWRNYKQVLTTQVLDLFIKYQQRFKNLQTNMLFLSEKLIISRLHSLSCCALLHSKLNNDEHEWEEVFGTGSLKHLCKLIEAYNRMLRLRGQKENVHVNQYMRRVSSQTLFDVAPSSSIEHSLKPNILKESSPLQPFSVLRIVTALAGPAKDDLAASLLHILSLIHKGGGNNDDEYEEDDEQFLPQNIDWGDADDIEFDEDQVITHVGSFPVNNISNATASDDTLSSVKQLLYAQGSFIVSFINCLAANSSLLRGRLRSKSPRSMSSTKFLADDVSAISSEDDASSVASSSFFSHFSSSGAPVSSRRRKMVVWRDSWDHEAVKTFCKSYIASLVTEGPSLSLQSLMFKPDSYMVLTQRNYYDDDSGASDQVVTTSRVPDATACFRPRFWSDAQALTLDASVTNMLTLEILPDDILGSLQESTQAFVIDKAFTRWDSTMCEALGVSIKDKCGSIPLEGSTSLSKTAWTYIKALHTLMFIMDRYHSRDDVAQLALPRLEATLDSFYNWCHGRIERFLTSWSLRPLLQVSLGDLSQLTALGLDCLPLVEKCHNRVENRRMENPAALMLATKQLKSIDQTITNMQSLSGQCMSMYVKKCCHLSTVTISSNFPSQKLWRLKNLTDHSSASSYMDRAVTSVIQPICTSVAILDIRSQLAAVPPAITSVMDAVVRWIVRKNIRFSVQGAVQLQRDFDHVVDYVCADETGLCREVKRAVPFLKSVKRALWVASTLQRTDVLNDDSGGKVGYQDTRRKKNRSTHVSPASEEYGDGEDDGEWNLKERDLLALRILDKGESKCGKGWCPLPCSKKLAD